MRTYRMTTKLASKFTKRYGNQWLPKNTIIYKRLVFQIYIVCINLLEGNCFKRPVYMFWAIQKGPTSILATPQHPNLALILLLLFVVAAPRLLWMLCVLEICRETPLLIMEIWTPINSVMSNPLNGKIVNALTTYMAAISLFYHVTSSSNQWQSNVYPFMCMHMLDGKHTCIPNESRIIRGIWDLHILHGHSMPTQLSYCPCLVFQSPLFNVHPCQLMSTLD